MKKFNLVGAIMDYESGNMTDTEMLVLFSELVKSGMAWSLQGSYGRTANALIESGYINRNGKILKEVA